MKSFNAFYFYLCLLVINSFLLVLSKFTHVGSSPFFFTLVFFVFVLSPGFFIFRSTRANQLNLKNTFAKIVIYGLGFFLIINLVGIFLGLSLPMLEAITIILWLTGFSVALARDLREKLKIDRIKLASFLYLLPLGLLSGFLIWLLYKSGPNLNGDPYFHISIINKAFEGASLSSRSLAFTKTLSINPAYLYPVWHVFLAMCAKVFSITPTKVWENLIFPLTLLSIFSWYYLASVIFQNKSWSIFASLMALIFILYGGPGYLFSRLGVPDTLSQLMLLPLAIALVGDYIFSQKSGEIYPIILLSIILLIIHAPHYFYLFLIYIVVFLIFLIFYRKDNIFNRTIVKFGRFFSVELMLVIASFIGVEILSKNAMNTLIGFFKSPNNIAINYNFAKFGLLYKIGLVVSPFMLLSLKSKRVLILISSVFLTPLIYWTPLKSLTNKLFSGIFTDRLLANTGLYFFVFTIILCVIISYVDNAIPRLSNLIKKIFLLAISLIFIVIVSFEAKLKTFSNFIYYIFYSKNADSFVNRNYPYILAIVIIVCAILYFCGRSKINIREYKNRFFAWPVLLIIAFLFITPSIVNSKNIVIQSKTYTEQYFMNLLGNSSTGLKVAQGLPANSVILADSQVSKALAVLTSNYMAYNVGSSYEKKFAWVFDPKNPDNAKLSIVTDPKWQIDYVYLEKPEIQNSFFRGHPDLYQIIYSDSKTEIYKTIK